ncbi:MAG: UDP-glucose 4-epimerase GalE [bacterium]|nr:UDP-glucose 4-epimerase GalE [bacterium]
MNVLVTGGAGYIGSVTVELLAKSGHKAVVIDNLSEGHKNAVPERHTLITADIADGEKLDAVFTANKIDAVMHFAAHCYVGESVKNPAKYYDNNVIAGLKLLNGCVRHKVEKFIFSSSCATYGIPEKIPITEEEKQIPVNPYGETKLAFEKALKRYSAAYGIKYSILRYFNAAGAAEKLGEDHRPETHLIPLILGCAMGKREKVEIFGTDYSTPDGTCIRDYIHVSDIARAHILAMESDFSDCYNLGNGSGYSVKEVIKAAEKVTGKKIKTAATGRREGDPPILIGDSKKISEKLAWKPAFASIEKIISSAWKWHRKNPEGYKE